MELRITPLSLPEIIEFNYDEIKAELIKKVEDYTDVVYTDDKIQEAKNDVATLRKFTKALSDARIGVKKECLKPYEEFERRINELTELVNKPINQIDLQVKQYADNKKNEKRQQIESYFDEQILLGCVTEGITLMQIFDEKWLNASVSMKKVQDDIDSRLVAIKEDIATLEKLPAFGFEAKAIYMSTLDLNRAIAEGQRLADIQRQKEEYEKQKEYEAQKAAAMEAAAGAANRAAMAETQDAQTENVTPEQPKTVCMQFWAELTADQATALRDFFKVNGIKYGQI